MEFAIYAALMALGVFAVFAACGAAVRAPVAGRGRIYNGRHDAARRP